jgi:hypothetical protein
MSSVPCGMGNRDGGIRVTSTFDCINLRGIKVGDGPVIRQGKIWPGSAAFSLLTGSRPYERPFHGMKVQSSLGRVTSGVRLKKTVLVVNDEWTRPEQLGPVQVPVRKSATEFAR